MVDTSVSLTIQPDAEMSASTLSTDNEGISAKLTNTPVDVEGDPILWDGNPATLEGVLHETARYYKRRGYYQLLLDSGAVLLSTGKIALDSVQAVQFVGGLMSSGFGIFGG